MQTLSKVINSKNAIQILESFLFEVADGKIKITASDAENVLSTSIAIEDSTAAGKFCIGNHVLLNALRDLPEQPLTFDVDVLSGGLKLIYMNGLYTLPIMGGEDYPTATTLQGEASIITLDAGVLSSNIARTIYATAQDEIRPVMNGIYFDLGTESLSIVASDGHKLVRNRNFSVKSERPSNFILPKKPAQLLRGILEKQDGVEVVIKFNGSNAEISFAVVEFICRRLDGRHPNYNSIIPQANPNQVVIDRKQLLSGLKRVTPFAGNTQLTRFHIEQGKLELKSEDIDFAIKAEESLSCQYNGLPMNIGFKGTSFAEILNNIESEEVNIQLSDPVRAGVIVPSVQAENEEVLVLIMPILLND